MALVPRGALSGERARHLQALHRSGLLPDRHDVGIPSPVLRPGDESVRRRSDPDDGPARRTLPEPAGAEKPTIGKPVLAGATPAASANRSWRGAVGPCQPQLSGSDAI